jgi:glycolate oxidase FAD binding subunit
VIPAPLAAACPQVRPGTEADAVGGVRPQYVAEPASTGEAGAVLRAAAGLGLAVVPRGGGTRLDWGLPPRQCDLVVDTRRLDQVLEHAAGDLVARVQAGVPLERLARILATAGQRLAVDPPAARAAAAPAAPRDSAAAPGNSAATPASSAATPASSRGAPASNVAALAARARDDAAAAEPPGTVGGLIATGVAGPLRLRFGSPRDLLIGITLVRADGTVARAGGKVVKNVAGYDIGKLLAGSYGTLGLITEATFRLHPRPPAAAWISVTCPPGAAPQAASALLAAASSPLAPVAAELDWPGREAPVTVAVALEGDPDGVAERAALMHDLLASAARRAPGNDRGTAAGDGRSTTGETPEDSRTTAEGTPDSGRSAASSDALRAGVPAPRAAGPGATIAGLLPPPRGAAAPDVSTEAPSWWGQGPAAASEGTVLRVAFWASQLAAVLTVIRAAAADAGLDPAIGGSAAAGVLHAALPAAAPPDAVARFVTGLRAALTAGAGLPGRASVVVLTAPPPVRGAVDMWGPVPSEQLMHAVKDRFDPEHRMSPGRFAGGI